jgi:hypothetical protein
MVVMHRLPNILLYFFLACPQVPLIHNGSVGYILVYHLMSFSFHDAMLVLLTSIIFCGP